MVISMSMWPERETASFCGYRAIVISPVPGGIPARDEHSED